MDGFARGLTRRRVLALGATGGLGLLVGVPAPGSAAAARVRTAGLALPRGAVPGGGRAGVVVRAPEAFDLVGLRGADLRGTAAELRVRRTGGRWSPWVPLGSGADHAPDHPRAQAASDPVWAGGADELQLRARRAVRGGRLQLITAPAAAVSSPARRAGVRAATAVTRQAGAPPIVPRAAWGAGAVPPRASPSYGAISVAFVHHTVSANTYAPEDSARIVLAIAKYHRDSNGWNDIGYNFLVDRYGQIFEGRAGGIDRAVIGAQAGGWNSQSTGMATIGDFAATPFPAAGMAALTRLIAWKLGLHGVPAVGTVPLISGGGSENRYPYGQTVTLPRVCGHRDGCKTACPGDALYDQLDDLRARVAAATPGVPVAPVGVATLVAAEPAVAYGQDAVLNGAVTHGDGTPAAGIAISVQKQTSAGTWVRVAVATSGADGRYESRVTWKRASPLRAVAQLAPGNAGRARSAPVSVGLVRTVAVTAPGERSRVLAGKKVAMTGTVGPSGVVRVLVERQEAGGRWVGAGEVRAAVTGTRFAAGVPLKKPALYRLTAITGPKAAPVRATPVFVRAVRDASKLTPP
ncbi:endolysin [Paraconexibacter sp. AEG42_29]|uniref:Endolysin n=1 Tax=Paraconexibacter sp. AEG42_29 TaxID=2997339 RepID=A0AAU7AZR7_9ACTN